jgi:hypothetical protein
MLEKLNGKANIHGCVSPRQCHSRSHLEINAIASFSGSLPRELQERLIHVYTMHMVAQGGPHHTLCAGATSDIRNPKREPCMLTSFNNPQYTILDGTETLESRFTEACLGIVLIETFMT